MPQKRIAPRFPMPTSTRNTINELYDGYLDTYTQRPLLPISGVSAQGLGAITYPYTDIVTAPDTFFGEIAKLRAAKAAVNGPIKALYEYVVTNINDLSKEKADKIKYYTSKVNESYRTYLDQSNKFNKYVKDYVKTYTGKPINNITDAVMPSIQAEPVLTESIQSVPYVNELIEAIGAIATLIRRSTKSITRTNAQQTGDKEFRVWLQITNEPQSVGLYNAIIYIFNEYIKNRMEIGRSSGQTALPSKTPVLAPTKTPAPAPVKTPEPALIKTPAPAPVKTPERALVKTPAPAPVKTPEPALIKTPVLVPTKTPDTSTVKPHAPLAVSAENTFDASKAVEIKDKDGTLYWAINHKVYTYKSKQLVGMLFKGNIVFIGKLKARKIPKGLMKKKQLKGMRHNYAGSFGGFGTAVLDTTDLVYIGDVSRGEIFGADLLPLDYEDQKSVIQYIEQLEEGSPVIPSPESVISTQDYVVITDEDGVKYKLRGQKVYNTSEDLIGLFYGDDILFLYDLKKYDIPFEILGSSSGISAVYVGDLESGEIFDAESLILLDDASQKRVKEYLLSILVPDGRLYPPIPVVDAEGEGEESYEYDATEGEESYEEYESTEGDDSQEDYESTEGEESHEEYESTEGEESSEEPGSPPTEGEEDKESKDIDTSDEKEVSDRSDFEGTKEMSTGSKVGLFLAAGAILGGAIWFMSKSKKGDTQNAKTSI